MKPETASIIEPHGGFRNLHSFQRAQQVYDLTVRFCDRFVDRRSRTHDQMVQAARSGVQNIAEGSMASATSKKTELTLTSVARSSLVELLLDYEDFLRHRGLRQWAKESPEALAVRSRVLGDASAEVTLMSDAERAANTIICHIHQATYLLGRQLRHLERRFVEQGGFSERMSRARREWERGK